LREITIRPPKPAGLRVESDVESGRNSRKMNAFATVSRSFPAIFDRTARRPPACARGSLVARISPPMEAFLADPDSPGTLP